MGKFKDLTGMKFGRLTVLELDHNEPRKSGIGCRYYYYCKCECGNYKIVRSDCLTKGQVKSCGCLHKESAVQNVIKNHTHKLSGTPVYKTCQGIKTRCLDTKCKCYERYGGRGITMFPAWVDDFQAFYDYVSKLPHFGERGYTLDRIDNDKGYAPGNVRWATATEQARNRRSNILVNYNGLKVTLIKAAELTGLDYKLLNERYHRGDRGDKLFRPIGTARKNIKLSDDDKKYIREKYVQGDAIFGMRPLAEKFGVTISAISYVLKVR